MTPAEAKALFNEEAAEWAVAAITDMEVQEVGEWTEDPEYDGVCGFVTMDGKRAFVVVYADGQWELANEVQWFGEEG